MKTSKFGRGVTTGIIAAVLLTVTALGGTRVEQIYVKQERPTAETLVYVTGSRLPQHVAVWETGAATAWPVRVIRRHEIETNYTGQRGTADVFRTEPSVRIIGR